jgi:hypothetical protein
MAIELVGRQEDLTPSEPSSAKPRRPCRVRARGQGGIGKSTIWLAGVEHARTRGWRVLASRPEAERGLAYVGLSDLFEDILDDALPALFGS